MEEYAIHLMESVAANVSELAAKDTYAIEVMQNFTISLEKLATAQERIEEGSHPGFRNEFTFGAGVVALVWRIVPNIMAAWTRLAACAKAYKGNHWYIIALAAIPRFIDFCISPFKLHPGLEQLAIRAERAENEREHATWDAEAAQDALEEREKALEQLKIAEDERDDANLRATKSDKQNETLRGKIRTVRKDTTESAQQVQDRHNDTMLMRNTEIDELRRNVSSRDATIVQLRALLDLALGG